MRKKGFTLIELLGVIVILGIIAAFSVPELTKTFKKTSDKQYDEFAKTITLAAENYFHNELDVSLDVKRFITIGELVQSGYLKKEVNPLTNKEVSESSTVVISKNADGTESYTFVDRNVTETGYNRDGLLVLFDGYHNIENGQWIDLSGNGNNGTVNNITWMGTNVLLNHNSNSNIFINSSISQPLQITMGITLKVNQIINDSSIFNNFDGGGVGFEIQSNKLCFIPYVSSLGYQPVCSSQNLEVNKLYSAIGTYDGQVISLYINGILDSSMQINGNIKKPENNTKYAIGCNPSGSSCQGFYSNINVYSVNLYNRALNSEEIYNNYIVDKYRFDVQ